VNTVTVTRNISSIVKEVALQLQIPEEIVDKQIRYLLSSIYDFTQEPTRKFLMIPHFGKFVTKSPLMIIKTLIKYERSQPSLENREKISRLFATRHEINARSMFDPSRRGSGKF